MSAEETTMTLGEKITHAMSFKTVFSFDLGPLHIPVTETVVVSWAVMAFLAVLAYLTTRRLRQVPKGFQILAEWFVSFINDFAKEQLGKRWWVFAPYLGTIGLYIFTSSVVGFISPVEVFGIMPPFTVKPPTRDINVTAALGAMTIFLVIFSTFRFQGFKGWLKGLFHPVPFMLPFNLLEYIIKPMSLALRLFGNILGAFIIMELLALSVPFAVPPIAGLYFDLVDSLIQSVVFVLLTTIYLKEAVAAHSEG
jgi:F-type H+-transporting ATPase subunit a